MRTKSEARRQAILDAASQVFLEKGFEQASMAEISARLGGSKATLYNYFGSKEEIFFETVRQTAERDALRIFELLDPDADLDGMLRSFGKALARFLTSPAVLAVRRMVYGAASQQQIGKDFYERGPSRFEGLLKDFLDQLVALGKLLPCDTRLAAQQLQVLIQTPFVERGLLRIQEEFDDAELDRSVNAAVRVFLAAYAAPAHEK